MNKSQDNTTKQKQPETYSQRATKGLQQMEDILLKDFDELIENHKKKEAKSQIEITEGERINLKFPGKVNIIARDHSGQVVEINNKEDVEYNTMSYRKEILDEKIEEIRETEFRKDLEFE